MGNHVSENSLGVTQWPGDCKVMLFLPNKSAQNRHVLCLMSTDGWGL